MIAKITAVALLALCGPTPSMADTPSAPPRQNATTIGLVDDADAGWTWSGMVPYSNPELEKGTGHAGGPGSYGVYTFSGTGVELYIMRSPAVDVEGHAHKCGKLKISIDGHLKAEANATADDTEFGCSVFSIQGLASKIHVLQVEPDAGWAVVDYIRINSGGDLPNSPPQAGPASGAALLLSSKLIPLIGNDVVEASSNVGGFNAEIGPELQIGTLPADWGLATIYAHSGDTAIRFSGSANAGPAYCYMTAYRTKIPVGPNTVLDYWILPQQDNARYVAVDLHFTDGGSLSRSDAVDADGISMAPAAGHGGAIPLYQWTEVRCPIGRWFAGQTIDKVWIGYSRNPGGGQYRGYIDDLVIENEPARK